MAHTPIDLVKGISKLLLGVATLALPPRVSHIKFTSETGLLEGKGETISEQQLAGIGALKLDHVYIGKDRSLIMSTRDLRCVSTTRARGVKLAAASPPLSSFRVSSPVCRNDLCRCDLVIVGSTCHRIHPSATWTMRSIPITPAFPGTTDQGMVHSGIESCCPHPSGWSCPPNLSLSCTSPIRKPPSL